jgi:hypothetical protein
VSCFREKRRASRRGVVMKGQFIRHMSLWDQPTQNAANRNDHAWSHMFGLSNGRKSYDFLFVQTSFWNCHQCRGHDLSRWPDASEYKAWIWDSPVHRTETAQNGIFTADEQHHTRLNGRWSRNGFGEQNKHDGKLFSTAWQLFGKAKSFEWPFVVIPRIEHRPIQSSDSNEKRVGTVLGWFGRSITGVHELGVIVDTVRIRDVASRSLDRIRTESSWTDLADSNGASQRTTLPWTREDFSNTFLSVSQSWHCIVNVSNLRHTHSLSNETINNELPYL